MEERINVLKMFSNILKENKIMIVIVGLVTGLLLTGIKWSFTDAAERSGAYTFMRMIKIQTFENNNEIAYDTILNSSENYYYFIKNTSDKEFDFTKLNSAWKRKNLSEQVLWLQQKVRIEFLHRNVFKIVVNFDPQITNNAVYLSEHGDFLADNFVRQSEKMIQKTAPEVSFSVIGTGKTTPQVVLKDQKKTLIKVSIAGFFVGVIGTIAMIFIYKLRQCNQTLKNECLNHM